MSVMLTPAQSDVILSKLLQLAENEKLVRITMRTADYPSQQNFEAFFIDQEKQPKGIWKLLCPGKSGFRIRWTVRIWEGRIDGIALHDTCYLYQVNADVDVEQIELADEDRLRAFILPFFADHLHARAEKFLSTITS
jgi:hypothetical protein